MIREYGVYILGAVAFIAGFVAPTVMFILDERKPRDAAPTNLRTEVTRMPISFWIGR